MPQATFWWIAQESPKSSLGVVFSPRITSIIQRMNRSFWVQTWGCWWTAPPYSKPAHFPRAWPSRATIPNLRDWWWLFLRNDKGYRNLPLQLHPGCELCNINGHMFAVVFFPVIFQVLPSLFAYFSYISNYVIKQLYVIHSLLVDV